MALALRPLLSESSMKSRCASQALAEGLRPGVESGDVSLAGFVPGTSTPAGSTSKSGDTSLAGFAVAAVFRRRQRLTGSADPRGVDAKVGGRLVGRF